GGGQRGGDLRGAGRGVVGQVQGGRSGDVRAGHGGAGDGVGGRVTGAPGGGDGGAGREQVEHRAVVGVARAGVAGGGGADRDGLGDPGGRLGGGVGGLVAGRDDEGDAGGDGVADGGVESAVGAAAEGHVGDGRLDRVAGHPVDAGDHLGGGAGAGVVQHPDGDDLRLLGDAVGAARDRAGHMGAVAVAVLGDVVVVDGVVAVGG